MSIREGILPTLRVELLEEGCRQNIRGLILLSTEGINANISGRPENVQIYLRQIESLTGMSRPLYKQGRSDVWGFKKLVVKIKRTIITMENKKSNCAIKSLFTCWITWFKRHFFSSHVHTVSDDCVLTPRQVESFLKETNVNILDIRNTYEVELGQFKNAQSLDMKEFGEFPEKIKQSSLDKDKKTLIYCTGGIRCEKALKEMKKQGFQAVYLLKGGILNYLKEYPHASFEGECFVFDRRVALDQQGCPSQRYALCPHCGQAGDQELECVHCSKATKICKNCLKKNIKHLMTCSKNCSHHFQQQ